MRAVVARGVGDLYVVDLTDPEPDGRAVVAVHLTGLCGTDVKILAGQIRTDWPRVLGHEVIGHVVRAGDRGLVAEGTRVLVNPSTWCGHCPTCLADRTHLCPDGTLMGRDVDGGFAELVTVDELQLHPLPDHIDDAAASVLQVLATCVHAQTLVDVFPGRTAAVIGLGVSGLLHLQLLRARGIERIVGITRSAWKRDLGLALGASAVAHPDDARAEVDRLTEGRGVDLVVEAAGTPATYAQAVDLAGPGGTVLVFGIVPELGPDLPAYELYFKELRLVHARSARARDYAAAVDLAASGRLDLERLWSRSFPLDRAPDAFDALSGDALKITLEVS